MFAFAEFFRQMQSNTTGGPRNEGSFCYQRRFRFHKCKEPARHCVAGTSAKAHE